MESNYEIMKRRMQGEFLKYDQEAMIRRFHLQVEANYLCFSFMGEPCRIHRGTGVVECAEDGQFREADYNEAMTVYDLLCWSKPEAAPSGEFVNVQSLSGLHSATTSSSKGFFSKERMAFDHREEALRAAIQTLGGKAAEGGDVAAKINVFNGLMMLFRFWNSDEEFDPEIQLLWDKNVLLYMHFETVWFANHALISRIHRGIVS